MPGDRFPKLQNSREARGWQLLGSTPPLYKSRPEAQRGRGDWPRTPPPAAPGSPRGAAAPGGRLPCWQETGSDE